MKRKILVALLLSLVPILSCAQKKDRLTSDTLTITVDPMSTQTVKAGSTLSLNAICKSAKSDNVAINPVWSVERNLGTFNPTAGRSTTFTAKLLGSGKIYATYGSVQGNVSVNVVSVLSGGGGGGGGTGGDSRLTLISDTQADSNLVLDGLGNLFWYFDTDSNPPPPPGNNNADGWQIATLEASPGCPLDPLKSTKISYQYNYAGTTHGWGGFFVGYLINGTGATQNLSAYTKMVFYVRGESGGEKFKVGMQAQPLIGPAKSAKVNVPDHIAGGVITTAWQKVSIPLTDFTGVNMSYVDQPFILAFEDDYTLRDTTVYIDYIGFE